MKLSGMFRIGFVAAIVTALILLPSCIAPVNQGGASTSTTQPSVETYMDHLNVETIIRLPDLERFVQGQSNFYDRVPFIYTDVHDSDTGTWTKIKAPLYSTSTRFPEVGQALRDHLYVGIVEVSKNDARLIHLVKEGDKYHLDQTVFTDGPSEAIRLLKLHPDLHQLRTLMHTVRSDNPLPQDIEDLAYANNRPILSEESETVGHMLSAARTNPLGFYYFQSGMPLILVKPLEDRPFHDSREQEVYSTQDLYLAAKRKYGQKVASLIWGKSIVLNGNSEDRLKPRIPLKDQRRFEADTPREDMVRALQDRGRFRVYKMTDRGDKVAYKVKLTNPGSTFEPMDVSVKPLTFIERTLEAIHLPRIHLPY
ncbi:hypothetical protein NDA13_000287 [Ustilago tritici]|nr:hypothetical protein NDA13_000287 [Ustilago tritici]